MYIHTCIHATDIFVYPLRPQWLSDDDCPSLAKVLLLLVDQIDQDICMAAQQAEELTYNIFGINDGYEGGDKHRLV